MQNASPGSASPVNPKYIRIGNPTPAIPQNPASTRQPAIITVVRDPNHNLGKRFDLNPDGTVSKKSAVNVSFGLAVQHEVSTPEAFVDLLKQVSEDPNAAIINASFDGIPVGEEFAILSEREIEKRLSIPCSDRERQKGVHAIEYGDKAMKAVGRFKENLGPSRWQLLDRDIDEQTPAEFANMSDIEWLLALAKILPGIDQVTTVNTRSTSSRVMRDGEAVGGGNGHVWFKLDNPDDTERVRAGIIVLAAQAGMAWPKQRFSRSEPGKAVGQSLATIIDPSVWTPGRLVFTGKPDVSDGLTVEPLAPTIHQREHDAFDTAAVTLPDAAKVREITRKAGVEMSVTTGHAGLIISTNDLTLDTEIEIASEKDGVLTVRQLVERGNTGKIRCQTPFRASESWAAFYNINADGIPFVHDVGTSTTHWLSEFEAEEVKIIPAQAVVKQLIPKVKEDAAAVLEDDAVKALAAIKQCKPADYQRKRAALKQANRQVSLSALDRVVKASAMEADEMATHHGYAKSLLVALTVGEFKPVGHHGALFIVDPVRGLWICKPVEALVRMVAEMHDGKERCERSADYRAIADHAISLASDDTYFADAPIGIACPGGFYRIEGRKIVVEPLGPHHRQRVMLDIVPATQATPHFDNFLHETFDSKNEGEEAAQVTLLQEITGAIMLGLMPRFQKAILYYDPFGRAGKGTLERIQRRLVPKEFVSAVSPFSWGKDYFIATLAGIRLNVVGELPDNESIPAAMFKTVIGGDLITGRHPTFRPITFQNEAAHIFMSNHLINTRDHSEAFFARWLIAEFPNSRLRSGLPLDPMLAERIIESEMPGIAQWALVGAARLLQKGAFSISAVHDRLMAKWRCTSNSLEEFIGEACVLFQDSHYRRSELYKDYTEWCSENGRKPFSKARVKELLEHNIGLGIRLVELDGYETFRGLYKKAPKPAPRFKAPEGLDRPPVIKPKVARTRPSYVPAPPFTLPTGQAALSANPDRPPEDAF